jgi:23S rRNA (cytidine1920-2'-O)/16S rRNA (cytidine1409-2'-O)-methyltransferase
VVRDEAARSEAIEGVRKFVAALGFEIVGLIDSPVHGPKGNVEALLAARRR